MKRSTDRILTTHVGSLPRPVDLLEMNDAKGSGRSIDQSAWAARVKTAVAGDRAPATRMRRGYRQ